MPSKKTVRTALSSMYASVNTALIGSKGLSILQKIVEQHPQLPVLMFTQYVQGPRQGNRGARHTQVGCPG